jgi:DNA-binding IclR family transcriptional regulator
MPSRETSLGSIQRAFLALSKIAECPSPMTPKELAQEIDTPLPTTYHLLKTLVDLGALVKLEREGYRLGPAIGALSDSYLEQGEPLRILEPAVRDLAKITGETTYMTAWRSGKIEVVVTVSSSRPVRVAPLGHGSQSYAHARASGKVMLAFARPSLREEYLYNNPLEKITPATIDNSEILEGELKEIVKRGYATDLEEYAPDVSCLSVPVLASGHLIAALTVSAPTIRFNTEFDTLLSQIWATKGQAERLLIGSEVANTV